MGKDRVPGSSEVNPSAFVLPLDMLARRISAGEGVREDDIPVHNDTYVALQVAEHTSKRVQGLMLHPAVLAGDGLVCDTADTVTVTQGVGPKAYPVGMSDSLKPTHSAERKQHVCEALAQELYRVLMNSSSGKEKSRFGEPYKFLVSMSETFIELNQDDLAKLGIGLHPGKGNLTLLEWIKSDVGPALTRLLTDDANFESSWITVSAQNDRPDALSFHLVKDENQASDGE